MQVENHAIPQQQNLTIPLFLVLTFSPLAKPRGHLIPTTFTTQDSIVLHKNILLVTWNQGTHGS